MPKVSVLLAVYNTKEEFLRECIESILNQSFKDFEFLIVNDGSTDEHVQKVLESYSDSRIRLIPQVGNQGITRTRNRLLDEARGEYLAVMDHDDVSTHDRLEKEVAYLDAKPEVGVVGSQATYIPSGQLVNLPSDDSDIRTGLLHCCPIIHPSCMILASVLRDNGIRYEPQFSPAEDYALWCRLIPHTRFHNLEDRLLNYRWHADNASITQANRMAIAVQEALSFARRDNPGLVAYYDKSKTVIDWIKVLGFIPLVKIIRTGSGTKYYLFNFLNIYSRKRRTNFNLTTI